MTSEEFNLEVEDFFNATQHPKFNKKYTQTTYQPMIELLNTCGRMNSRLLYVRVEALILCGYLQKMYTV
jgi:hypothetical protein